MTEEDILNGVLRDIKSKWYHYTNRIDDNTNKISRMESVMYGNRDALRDLQKDMRSVSADISDIKKVQTEMKVAREEETREDKRGRYMLITGVITNVTGVLIVIIGGLALWFSK